jgi:integrase
MPPRKDPLTGETYRPGETFDTNDEAYAWLLDQNARWIVGRPTSKITLGQCIKRRAAKAGLKQTTQADLRRVAGRLPDSLLDTEIRRITPEQITDWILGDLVKRPYKVSTMHTTAAHVSGVFTWATANGIETIGNPVRACGAWRLIRAHGPDDDDEDGYDEWFTHQFGRGPVWAPDQIRAFIEIEPYPYRALATFVAIQGTRRGETIGLRWPHFAETNRRIRVRTNITWTDEAVFEDTPKGGKRRWLLLDEMVVDALQTHRIHQDGEKSAYETWDSNDWIFTRRRHHKASKWWPGAHMVPTTVTSRVGYGAKKLGFPVIGTHGLRRSWATIAEGLGVPRKVRRDVLGHAGGSMTERYSRSTEAEIRAGLTTVREAIFPDWKPSDLGQHET